MDVSRLEQSGRQGSGTLGAAIGNSHLSHAPRSQNPYTIGGFGVLDVKCHVRWSWTPQIFGHSATVARASLKNPTALSPRVSLADFDGHGSETTHVESAAGRLNLRRRADAGWNLVVLLIGASAGGDN